MLADCRSSLATIPVEIERVNRSPTNCWICRLLRRCPREHSQHGLEVRAEASSRDTLR